MNHSAGSRHKRFGAPHVRHGPSVREHRKHEGLITRSSENFVPVLRSHPGFVSYDMIDAGDGVLVTISVFERQAEAIASDAEAAASTREFTSQRVPSSPQISEGPVLLRR